MIDLWDPDTYAQGPPHEAFAELRRVDPVHWQDIPGQPGYWAVLKHADVEYVARHSELFSSERGGVVLEDLSEQQLAQMRNMLLAMDPPRHRTYRKPLAPSFTAKVVAGMEEQVRAVCREVLDAVRDSRGPVDFVHDVAAHVPTRVIGRLMGLPRADWERVHRLAERVTHGQDPDVVGEQSDPGTASIEMAMYAIGVAGERRSLDEPPPDLTTLILGADFGGGPMSDIDFGSFFVQLVTAGNDTTRTMMSSALLALIGHRDQLARLRSDPGLIPGAIEETLRWANPLHYFRRTATTDTELRGVPVRSGQKVAMYYTSANRDEDVFTDPDAFDVGRHPNRHLSFGIAEHFCLGAHLARLEGRVFLQELLSSFAEFELAGEPKWTRSNLNNGLNELPVRLQPR